MLQVPMISILESVPAFTLIDVLKMVAAGPPGLSVELSIMASVDSAVKVKPPIVNVLEAEA